VKSFISRLVDKFRPAYGRGGAGGPPPGVGGGALPGGCILGMPAGLYTGYSQNDEIIAISLVASTQIPL